MKFAISIMLSFFILFGAEAGTVAEYFNALSSSTIDYEPTGAVCEQVAMFEVEQYYPKSQFHIVNSIEYGDNKKTIGELDLVIFSNATDNVEAVAEVKCWKNLDQALRKAKEQRARFLTNLDKKITLTDKDAKVYSKDKFRHINKYFTIAQLGSGANGFDFELSLGLKELMVLRKELLDCKAQGRCPKK